MVIDFIPRYKYTEGSEGLFEYKNIAEVIPFLSDGMGKVLYLGNVLLEMQFYNGFSDYFDMNGGNGWI